MSSLVIGQKYGFLIRSSKIANEECMPVECYCLVCKDQTKTKDGKSSYVDYFSKWTHGNTRPLYVERVVESYNCKRDNVRHNIGTRFIPVDESIPSIITSCMIGLADILRHLSISTISIFLDHQMPSSRISRKAISENLKRKRN